jgi:hypothetical protein
VHIGFEGDAVKIGGLRVWGTKWRRVQNDPINLPHPAHKHEMHPFWIYEIGTEEKPIRFAATELSAGVWGFYAPAE